MFARERAHMCMSGFACGGREVCLGVPQPLSPEIRLLALVPAWGKAGPHQLPCCPWAGSLLGQVTVVGAL